jgi:hypothetical protein
MTQEPVDVLATSSPSGSCPMKSVLNSEHRKAMKLCTIADMNLEFALIALCDIIFHLYGCTGGSHCD